MTTEDLDKRTWRRRITGGRAAVSAQQQVVEAKALAASVGELIAATGPATVGCYVPFGTEPGSIGLLDVLRDGGARVLLPIVPDERGPLDWSEYTGTAGLVPGSYRGILEPGGPRLGAEAIGDAELVLVPALAVDRRGARLGRGAGHYDRSLVFARDDVRLIALVRDDELVERLPAEPHDVRMSAALTPGHGLVDLDPTG
ncbi:5-formyltetrahydrofolate cyclo-ligase [Saccharomonospora sp. CUA-673]|uniref:5-formyltetrahydrofolate cyclo-ligase n=1 Tax=Saccharomonospora sp. CUA-673 TaxID=1904969 RepID=UPI0009603FDF|nr:5-formyltetrahydrofolate cyclo-ligase [Saccharomonospora sp. CUA-673]OLT41738.1 5-formyltetrahydrofolate cyclo-ligase [Saccharomonospora sp. CUA-673]